MNHVKVASCCKTTSQPLLLVWLVALFCVAQRFATTDALMVARHPSIHHAPPTLDTQDVSRSNVLSSTIRIRSMRQEDLPAVSALLASEIVDGRQHADSNNNHNGAAAADHLLKAATAWNNCKAHLERMKQKSFVETELRHRLHAIQEGRNVWSKLQSQFQLQQNTVPEQQQIQQQQQHLLRSVWSQDAFRSKVQCAVQLHQHYQDGGSDHNHHNNPHHHPLSWEEHDLNLTPADASWLQHVMMVAEDVVVVDKKGGTSGAGSSCTTTSTVIGFCEVGRMSTPLYYAAQRRRRQREQETSRRDKDDDDEEDIVGAAHHDDDVEEDEPDLFTAPTILNLVVSPNARRRGIATSLVSTAERYVRRTWDERQLCLYVDTNNHHALSLYQRLGFVPSQVQPPSPERLDEESESKHVVLWQQESSKATTESRHNRFRHLRRQLS